MAPDLIDVVLVANIQSYESTRKERAASKLEGVKSFKKLGLDAGITVVELDENSEEYQEALALFGMEK